MRKIIAALLLFCLLLPFQLNAAKVEIGKNNEILVDGKPFFPVMQWAQSKGKMSEQKSMSFNTYFGQGDSSSAKEYCDEAKKNGLYTIVSAKKPEEVSGTKDHPALLGWFHTDEPDMAKNGKAPRIPVSDSISYYENIKAKDSNHLMFLTLTTGFSKSEDANASGNKGKDISFYKQYAKATDVIGYDTYPIYGNNKPECLFWVGDAATELNRLMEGKKPLFAWIEANGGSKWITPSKQRHPLPFEIKCEAWMAIVRGCKAIGYFTHTWVAMDQIGNPNSNIKRGESKYYNQCGVPENNKQEIGKINRQITKLTNALCSADVKDRVKSDNREIEILVKENDNKLYIIAVNMKRQSMKAGFEVKDLKEKTVVTVDEEGRNITSKAGVFEDNFSEHAVHIYVIEQ